MLVNSNFNDNNDSKYALKSEIPTSLPANGGNADRISNVTIDDIFHSVGLNAISDIDNTSGNWSVGIVTVWEGVSGTFPDNCPDWVIINQYKTSGNHFVMQTCITIENIPKMWVRSKHVDFESWGSWQRVNDDGNADTLDGMHASDFVKYTGGIMIGELFALSNANYASPQVRNISMSTSNPSGGSNGQVHFKYS